MGTTPNNGYFQDGAPLIQPFVIYGANGKPISSTNPLDIQVDVTTGAPTDIVASGTIAGTTAVTATFGAGAASWTADISGTVGAGTVLQFEYLVNTTWFPAFGVVVGSNSDVAVSSVTLASASVTYQGNAAGFQQFRVRCSSYNGTDSLSIKIIGSVATDGGFVSKSLPPGTNNIGKVTEQVGGVDVSASNPLPTTMLHGNVVSTANSSTSVLTANSVFTGTGESSLNYSAISVEVFADQASAASGLQIQQSQDNTNWDTTDSFTISASTAFSTSINLVGQYFRVKYTNGGTGQGTFRLQTIKQAAESVMPRSLTALGNLKMAIQEAITLAVSQAGTWTVQPGNTANTTAWKVDASGVAVPITHPTSATSTITSVVGAASSTQLLASNTSRKGMFVFNDSTAILYLAFAGSASTTAYTVQVPANSFFEMPVAPVYTGAIFGIWAAANGNARITELT